MHSVILSDQDVLLIHYALSVFVTAVEYVREDWRDEDYQALVELQAEIATLVEADRRAREVPDATHTD